MKYTYTLQHAEVPTKDYRSTTAICTGGSFLPADGRTEMRMTSPAIIASGKDYIQENNKWLGELMGQQYCGKMDDGYIGKWTNEIDTKGHVYYCTLFKKPTKMVITEQVDSEHLSSIGNVCYVAKVGDDCYEINPEEGDVVFDTVEEAIEYLK